VPELIEHLDEYDHDPLDVLVIAWTSLAGEVDILRDGVPLLYTSYTPHTGVEITIDESMMDNLDEWSNRITVYVILVLHYAAQLVQSEVLIYVRLSSSIPIHAYVTQEVEVGHEVLPRLEVIIGPTLLLEFSE
jgi:hypothetical protein